MSRSAKPIAAAFMITFMLAIDSAAAKDSSDAIPWPRQYKIKPDQKARLTAADVVGPDGIVYPNWTRCGVQGKIPASHVVA